MGSEARKRARLFPLLLYHLLSTRTLPFWTIFFGVLSPILRRKRRASFAPAVKAHCEQRDRSCVCSKSICFIRRVPNPCRVRKELPRDERRRDIMEASEKSVLLTE